MSVWTRLERAECSLALCMMSLPDLVRRLLLDPLERGGALSLVQGLQLLAVARLEQLQLLLGCRDHLEGKGTGE